MNYFWAFVYHIFKCGLGDDGMSLHLIRDDNEWVLHDIITDYVDTYETVNELEIAVLTALQAYLRRK